MPVDLILAYKWVYLSAYLGREKSKAGLEIIKRAIKHRNIPNGIAEGQRLADEWLAKNKEWLESRELTK